MPNSTVPVFQGDIVGLGRLTIMLEAVNICAAQRGTSFLEPKQAIRLAHGVV
jgi:hypothetical protein